MKKDKTISEVVNPKKTISFESKWINLDRWDDFMKMQKNRSNNQPDKGVLRIHIY